MNKIKRLTVTLMMSATMILLMASTAFADMSQPSTSDDNNPLLFIFIGAGALVLMAGTGIFMFIKNKRG